MLVKALMIIIGSISTTILIFVALVWGGTFLESIELTDIKNPIDEIAEHAERIANKVNAVIRESKDEREQKISDR